MYLQLHGHEHAMNKPWGGVRKSTVNDVLNNVFAFFLLFSIVL